MKKIISLAFSVFMLLATLNSNAQTDLRKKQFNLDKSGLAVLGYDVVAYFTQGKAVKGNKSFAVLAEGAIYYFSTAANKELFKANYTKYEPKIGRASCRERV